MLFSWKQIVARLFSGARTQARKTAKPRSYRLEVESLEDRVVPSSYDGLNIPDSGVRLLFTPSSLAQAKNWFASHPFTPSSSDALGNAFAYQMTGNTTYAQNAITQLMNFTISSSELSGVASDTYRWNQWVPVVFDWCYNQMTSSQISTFEARYDSYTSTICAKSWGGPTMPSNNYFWGYWSNELNWGIATYGRDPNAAGFIDDAVKTRWNAFTAWANTTGNGGIPQEGTQYGRYMLEYPDIALTTAANEGLNLLQQTSFFQDAAYYLLYSTSPMPVVQKSSGSAFAQLFPFNDDEASLGNPPANDPYYGDFMTMIAEQYSGTPLGGYARQWLATVGNSTDYFMQAIDSGGSNSSYSGQPTDYYAPGPGYLYAKDSWGSSAMSAFFQLGGLTGIGHAHQDMGAFQLLQNGEWLSKQTTGYSSSITGYQGQGTASVSDTLATNGVYVGGQGEASAYQAGNPTVTRLESQPNYTFASTDLTQAYLSTDSRFNNASVASVVRDFIFVKPLDTLLVFDRVQTTSSTAPVTFLLHFPNQPTISGNTVVGVDGSQALQLTTLTPSGQSAPSLNVYNDAPSSPDSSTDYQYRLEETTSGQGLTYLINVLQGRGVNGPQVTATMTENATSFTITLKDPSGRTAVIVLQKGATSTGGQFGYSTSGTPSMNNLASGVESITATTSGVTWGNSSSGSFGVSGPSSSVAGTSFNITVKALTSSGSLNTGYTGTVHFTSTDVQAVLPGNYTFTAADAGVHTFTITLKTAGNDGITATDVNNSSDVGSTTVSVSPAAASTLSLAGYPTQTTPGTANNFTVQAVDPYGNVATGYADTVHFSSSDATANLPADYTFTASDAGKHTFTATLNTVGTQSLTAADKQNTSLTATESGIVVSNQSSGYTLLGNTTPPNPSSSDSSAVEVGVRFYADESGTITGLRFYKGSGNTGTHVGDLWTSSGTLLASATFTGESASGWQQVNFATPVAISAGTTYIAAYHTNVGHYAYSYGFFNSQLDSGPLHAPAGNNGVFAYGASDTFPTGSYNNTNYYVDVVYAPSAPTVTSVSPANGATNVSTGATVTVTFNEPLNSATVNANTVQLLDNNGNAVAATVSYNSANNTATLTPSAALAAGTTYTVDVHGGSNGIANGLGQTMSGDFKSSFTTAAQTQNYTLFGNTTPPNPSSSDASAVEVGVRFYADETGFITGLRFYKGSGNTGTHVADLWTSSGTKLATATFTGESAGGWQQVNFATPVATTAGTTYVASYYAPAGHYAYSYGFFNSQYNSGPLHAPAGGNGVYAYGSAGTFPKGSYNNTNYYVDVVYTSSVPSVASVTPANGSTGVNVAAIVTVTFNEPVSATSVNTSTVQLIDNKGNVVAATVTYNSTTWTATLTPTSPLLSGTTYKILVHGGANGITNLLGQTMTNDFSSVFTTQ